MIGRNRLLGIVAGAALSQLAAASAVMPSLNQRDQRQQKVVRPIPLPPLLKPERKRKSEPKRMWRP